MFGLYAAAEVVGTLNCVPFYIILVYYEHYDIYFWNLMLYYFCNVSFLCVCLCTFSLFLHVHFICMHIYIYVFNVIDGFY